MAVKETHTPFSTNLETALRFTFIIDFPYQLKANIYFSFYMILFKLYISFSRLLRCTFLFFYLNKSILIKKYHYESYYKMYTNITKVFFFFKYD